MKKQAIQATGDDKTVRHVVFVTGLSGAGKSIALNAFEDMDYQAVDNLPLPMVEDLLALPHSDNSAPMAVGIDSRTLSFSPAVFVDTMRRLRAKDNVAIHVLFMDASDDVLIQRFSETRRRHPLARNQILRAAIAQERNLMADVRQAVDGIIDTSGNTAADTKRQITKRFADKEGARLLATFMSFGFAHGAPRDADLVFDVRFLRNPHYVPELKPLTGRDEDVANYVRADEGFGPFTDKVNALLDFVLPRYLDEGKSYLTIAFGCTGGRHRSVTLAEHFLSHKRLDGISFDVFHRELAIRTV